MTPIISNAVFKGFLCRVHKICSKRYIDEEIKFLIDVFTENGYSPISRGRQPYQFC